MASEWALLAGIGGGLGLIGLGLVTAGLVAIVAGIAAAVLYADDDQ